MFPKRVIQGNVQITLPSSKIHEFEILFRNRNICSLFFFFICKYINEEIKNVPSVSTYFAKGWTTEKKDALNI